MRRGVSALEGIAAILIIAGVSYMVYTTWIVNTIPGDNPSAVRACTVTVKAGLHFALGGGEYLVKDSPAVISTEWNNQMVPANSIANNLVISLPEGQDGVIGGSSETLELKVLDQDNNRLLGKKACKVVFKGPGGIVIDDFESCTFKVDGLANNHGFIFRFTGYTKEGAVMYNGQGMNVAAPIDLNKEASC